MASDTNMHAAEIARLSRELEDASERERRQGTDITTDIDPGALRDGVRLVKAFEKFYGRNHPVFGTYGHADAAALRAVLAAVDERERLRAALAEARAERDCERVVAATLQRILADRDRELAVMRERERRLRAAVLDAIRRACRCDEYYRAIEHEDPNCQAHDIEDLVEQVFEAAGMAGDGQPGE